MDIIQRLRTRKPISQILRPQYPNCVVTKAIILANRMMPDISAHIAAHAYAYGDKGLRELRENLKWYEGRINTRPDRELASLASLWIAVMDRRRV